MFSEQILKHDSSWYLNDIDNTSHYISYSETLDTSKISMYEQKLAGSQF